MKVICAFDSFKGCISAQEACASARDAVWACYPDAEVVCLPMSDGGEGMTACMATSLQGEWREVEVHGPLMERVMARYFISQDRTANMEMASASGLSLVPLDKRNPMLTTTWGVGEMILDAVNQGCKHIVMGIGGSATCDGGSGMVDCLMPHLPLDVEVTVASDVQNPLCGPDGSAHVFGPQKGATPEQVGILDERLLQFALHTEKLGYADPTLMHHPGAGAGGGIGYGLMAYLKAKLVSGIDLLLEQVHFTQHLESASLVLTGEGCSDVQTLMGKVPMGVLSKARQQDVPVMLLSGGIRDKEMLLKAGFEVVRSINEHDLRPLSVHMERDTALHNLQYTVRSVLADS